MKNVRNKSRNRRKKHHCNHGKGNSTALNGLNNSIEYFHNQYGDCATSKDRLLGKWVEKRVAEIRKACPTLGFHYDLAVSSSGLLGIQMKNGNMIAIIPVLPGAEMADRRIYPQHGEPLESGNLEYEWEKWYELNKLIGNEKELFKSMKYYDEILEYTLANDLFNRKKIMSLKFL